jgi:DNA-binding NarL/FixJ family response regulator
LPLHRFHPESIFLQVHLPNHIPVHRVSDKYDEFELVESLKGQDAVISTIATEGIPQQKAIINAAIKAGVKHFVLSEFSHDTLNEQAAEMLPQIFKVKARIVEYLKSKEKEGLNWTALVTGPFFEM